MVNQIPWVFCYWIAHLQRPFFSRICQCSWLNCSFTRNQFFALSQALLLSESNRKRVFYFFCSQELAIWEKLLLLEAFFKRSLFRHFIPGITVNFSWIKLILVRCASELEKCIIPLSSFFEVLYNMVKRWHIHSTFKIVLSWGSHIFESDWRHKLLGVIFFVSLPRLLRFYTQSVSIYHSWKDGLDSFSLLICSVEI